MESSYSYVLLRRLRWNTEIFRKVKHISFKALRFRWQKLLLSYLSKNLPPSQLISFKELKNFLYSNYDNGFYVYAKPDDISSIKLAVDYVVRYTGRPAMAQSRILNYDGEYVTFYYKDMKTTKELKKLFMCSILLKNLSFIFLMNILK